jgi:hypothetical protein
MLLGMGKNNSVALGFTTKGKTKIFNTEDTG